MAVSNIGVGIKNNSVIKDDIPLNLAQPIMIIYMLIKKANKKCRLCADRGVHASINQIDISDGVDHEGYPG